MSIYAGLISTARGSASAFAPSDFGPWMWPTPRPSHRPWCYWA
jgi:hypothetical protein